MALLECPLKKTFFLPCFFIRISTQDPLMVKKREIILKSTFIICSYKMWRKHLKSDRLLWKEIIMCNDKIIVFFNDDIWTSLKNILTSQHSMGDFCSHTLKRFSGKPMFWRCNYYLMGPPPPVQPVLTLQKKMSKTNYMERRGKYIYIH